MPSAPPAASPALAAPTANAAPPPDAPAPPDPQAQTPEPAVSHWRNETADDPQEPGQQELGSLAARALRSGLKGTQEQPPIDALAKDDDIAPPVFDDPEETDDEEYSQFGYSAPFTRRRNSAKMWTLAAAAFAVLATGTIAAVNYYGLPDWAPFARPTFGIGKPGLQLNFPTEQNRSETLESGESIFRVRGTITNTARETLAVPNLLIVFRDERDRQVANWVVAPAKRELAPGESLNVTEAIADIPPAAVFAEIGWAPR